MGRADSRQHTFLFADLAGYTALTEAHGDEQAAELAAPVVVFAAYRDRTSDAAGLDPVCRMMVSPGREAGELTHDGQSYCFCSLECAARFAANPLAYTGRGRP